MFKPCLIISPVFHFEPVNEFSYTRTNTDLFRHLEDDRDDQNTDDAQNDVRPGRQLEVHRRGSEHEPVELGRNLWRHNTNTRRRCVVAIWINFTIVVVPFKIGNEIVATRLEK